MVNDFREILKELISETGLSLRGVARSSGVNVVQYSRYLNGGVPTVEIAVKIAQHFNCSLDFLFGLTLKRTSEKYKSYKFDMAGFVERYRLRLEARGLTHFKFAKMASFNESIIRHWKSGKMPRMDVIYEIAVGLDGSIDKLIGRA